MAHKKKHTNPVPPANQPQSGPPDQTTPAGRDVQPGGAPFQDQDEKRRLGNYSGAGEHPYQQPGGLNDADR